MPTYVFKNKKTGKETVKNMTISEAEEFAARNPHLDWMCGAPGIGDPWRLGRLKPSDTFRDRLREIKRAHGPRSTIDVK